MSSSTDTLRSVQKTSGLFDTVKAGNATVAGKASKTAGLDLDGMDIGGLVPTDEDLGGFIADMPFDLLEESDYLDSFIDLSNFLVPESSNQAVGSAVDNGEIVKEEMFTDFSGIISNLDPEPAVVEAPPEVPTSTTSLRKRRRVDYEENDADEYVINVVDLEVSDHDYVTKKRKLTESVTAATSSHHVTSTSQLKAAPFKSTDKYRERRDKNNEASRRSRQIRKLKFVEMDKEADELEKKNEALRKKIVELEALAKTMKAALIKKMTEK